MSAPAETNASALFVRYVATGIVAPGPARAGATGLPRQVLQPKKEVVRNDPDRLRSIVGGVSKHSRCAWRN